MNRPISLKNVCVEYAQCKTPEESVTDDDIVVFLAGVTPQYGGPDPAKFSWRDSFTKNIDKILNNTNSKIVLVCPEPETRRWQDTKYGMSGGQITWEHKWLERSNIILFWHETRWKPNKETLINCYHGPNMANIGIQFRFEVGLYIANKEKVRIFYVPDHAEGVAGVAWWFNNKKDSNLHSFDNVEAVVLQTVNSIKQLCC